MRFDSTLFQTPPRFAQVMAALVSLIGGNYLIAWFLGDMAALGSQGITMKTNTALALVLASAALFLLAPLNRSPLRLKFARFLAVVVFLIGFFSYLENVSPLNFGIDEILMREPQGALGVESPNRMGIPASLCFIFAGAALFRLSFQGARTGEGVQLLAAMITGLGFFGVMGYFYQIEPMFGIPQLTAIAFPTAFAFLLFGIGLLLVRPTEGTMGVFIAGTPGSALARKLFFPFLIFTLLAGYVELLGQRLGLFDPTTGTGLMTLFYIIFFTVVLYYNAKDLNQKTAAAKAAQDAVVKKEEELLEAQRLALIGSWYLDAKTREITASPETYRIQGLDSFKPYPVWDQAAAAIDRGLETGQGYEMDLEVKRPDGKGVWITARGEAVRDSDDRITGLRGTVQDITARKHAEEALRISEERYRTLFEAIDEGFCVIEMIYDAQGMPVDYRFLEINHSFEKHTGLSHAVGRRIKELVPDHEKEWFEIYGRVAMTGEPVRFQNHSAHMNRWFDVFAFPIDKRERKKIAVVFNDITQSKLAEEALRKMNQDLKDLTIHLELRVQERTRQLEEQAVQLRQLAVELTEAEQRERKRLAQVLHDHLQQFLVASLMRIAALERTSATIDKQAIEEVRSFIEEASDASRSLTAELRPPVLYEGGLGVALKFLVRKVETQHQLKVNLTVSPEANPASDSLKALIYECIKELLLNAAKHSGVSECSLVLSRLSGGNIRIEVSDEGEGFNAAEIAETRAGGFGLFSIRERIKALGGEFKIRSTPGKGTMIEMIFSDKIKLPEVTVADEAVVKKERAVVEKGTVVVLLADDHKIVRQALSSLLVSQPFIKEVIEAEDGVDAVRKFREFDPDIVIMDLNMPLMNGIEATRLIHELDPTKAVIGLSVQTQAETAQAMINAGAVAYFHKGEDTETLLDTIKNLASNQAGASF